MVMFFVGVVAGGVLMFGALTGLGEYLDRRRYSGVVGSSDPAL